MWFFSNTVPNHVLIRDVASQFQKIKAVVLIYNVLSALVGCVGHVANRPKDRCTLNKIQNVSKKKKQFYHQQLLLNWFSNIWASSRIPTLTLSFVPNVQNAIQSIQREARAICLSALNQIVRKCSATFVIKRLVALIIIRVAQTVMLTVSLGTIFDEGKSVGTRV